MRAKRALVWNAQGNPQMVQRVLRNGGFEEYLRAESAQLRAAKKGVITVTSRPGGLRTTASAPTPVATVDLMVQWTPSVAPYTVTVILEDLPEEPFTQEIVQIVSRPSLRPPLNGIPAGSTVTVTVVAGAGAPTYTPYVVALPAAVQAPAPVLEQMQTEPVFGSSVARLVWAVPPGTQPTTGTDPTKAYLSNYQIQWPDTPDSGWLISSDATASAWFQVTRETSRVVLTAVGPASSAVGPTLVASVPAAAPANLQAVWQPPTPDLPALISVTMDPPGPTITSVTIVVDNTTCTQRYSHNELPVALIADPVVIYVADPSLSYYIGAWFSADVAQPISDPSSTATTNLLRSYLAGVDISPYNAT